MSLAPSPSPACGRGGRAVPGEGLAFDFSQVPVQTHDFDAT